MANFKRADEYTEPIGSLFERTIDDLEFLMSMSNF